MHRTICSLIAAALLPVSLAGCSLAADAWLGNADPPPPPGEAVIIRPSQAATGGDQSAATAPSPLGSAEPSSRPDG